MVTLFNEKTGTLKQVNPATAIRSGRKILTPAKRSFTQWLKARKKRKEFKQKLNIEILVLKRRLNKLRQFTRREPLSMTASRIRAIKRVINDMTK